MAQGCTAAWLALIVLLSGCALTSRASDFNGLGAFIFGFFCKIANGSFQRGIANKWNNHCKMHSKLRHIDVYGAATRELCVDTEVYQCRGRSAVSLQRYDSGAAC